MRLLTLTVIAVISLGFSAKAIAGEYLGVRNQAACVAKSLSLGNPAKKKLQKCWASFAKQKSFSRAKRAKQRGTGFDSTLRSIPCPQHFPIDTVPIITDDDDGFESKLTKSYLERFQKRLIPFGKRIAVCYAQLAKGVVPTSKLKEGRFMVELEIKSTGSANQVVLTEKTNLDGHVVGCVVRELCGLQASPPPSGQSFYLELPFTFKKPK